MFQRLLVHKEIKVLLLIAFREIENEVRFGRMLYTGSMDDRYNYMHGYLPHRNPRFRLQYQEIPWSREVRQINYFHKHTLTCITEFKHLTGQRHHSTSFETEHPHAYVPIIEKLKENDTFAWRLANHKYYYIGQAAPNKLELFEQEVVL